MSVLELMVILLAIAAGLHVVAQRTAIPQPVLLVLAGLALVFVPGLPRIDPDPELIFNLFVPPLLFWGARTTSLRELWRSRFAVLRLATALVLLTIGVVAVTARAVDPEFTWGAAFVLGAIVSPPDPVAATASIRGVALPGAVSTLLEGEGLINDATALVSFRLAVAAVVSGSFSVGRAAGGFLLTGLGGAAIGVAIGWLLARVHRLTHDLPIAENTISLLTPFLAWIPAEAAGASGVLAVVALGLYGATRAPLDLAPRTRTQADAMWTMLAFLLESAIFMLIGLELPRVLEAIRAHGIALLAGIVALVTLACVLTRVLYVAIAVLLLRRVRTRRGKPAEPPVNEAAFVAWAGIRGGDSLVIALALPVVTRAGAPFPARDVIIFTTFGVIFATLVLQGLTLRPVARWLHLRGGDVVEREVLHARQVMAHAALRRLASFDGQAPPAVVARLRDLYERRLARDRRRLDARTARDDDPDARARLDLYAQLLAAERAAMIALRDRGTIGGDALRAVERDLDLRTLLLDLEADPDAPLYEQG